MTEGKLHMGEILELNSKEELEALAGLLKRIRIRRRRICS